MVSMVVEPQFPERSSYLYVSGPNNQDAGTA